MKLIQSILVLVALVLVFAVGFYFEELGALEWGRLTGAAVEEVHVYEVPRVYSWTTALCGTDNWCIDVHVACNGSQILNVTPVSPTVWHSEDWEDPRGGNPMLLCR